MADEKQFDDIFMYFHLTDWTEKKLSGTSILLKFKTINEIVPQW